MWRSSPFHTESSGKTYLNFSNFSKHRGAYPKGINILLGQEMLVPVFSFCSAEFLKFDL